jgi:predicted MFS family arabinose efflux permease
VGGLGIAAWLSRHPLERRVGHWMFGCVALYGVSILVFGLSSWFWLSMICLAVSGAADMVSVVIRQSLVQLETPDEMRGRVGAVNGTFIQASNQLGEFRAGAIAAWLGPVGSVLVGAIGTLLVVALWIRFFPPLVKRDRMRSQA